MFARDVKPTHRTAFLALLDEIRAFVPIDQINLARVLEMRKFPKGQAAFQLATSRDFADQCLPYEPLAGLIGAANHVSNTAGIYEFALRDLRESTGKGPEDTQVLPISIALLPSGHRVLKIYGLTLDTRLGLSEFKKGTLAQDKLKFNSKPIVGEMVRKLIETFPIGENDAQSRAYRDQALTELQGN